LINGNQYTNEGEVRYIYSTLRETTESTSLKYTNNIKRDTSL